MDRKSLTSAFPQVENSGGGNGNNNGYRFKATRLPVWALLQKLGCSQWAVEAAREYHEKQREIFGFRTGGE